MGTIQRETEKEQDAVFEWRFAELERAGFSRSQAFLLASARDVDLRFAERLLAAGCPPTTATRILV